MAETGRALRGFTTQHTIEGPAGLDVPTFLEEVEAVAKNFLRVRSGRKINFILTCTMEKGNDKVVRDSVPFLSATSIILEGTDLDKVYNSSTHRMMESMSNFQKLGSGWRFVRVEKLDINSVIYKPLRASSYIPLPKKLAGKKAIVNIKNSNYYINIMLDLYF